MGAMKASEFNSGRIVEAKRLELNACECGRHTTQVSQERLVDAYKLFAPEEHRATTRQGMNWLRGKNDTPGRQFFWLADGVNSLIPEGCPVEKIAVPVHGVGGTANPSDGLGVKAA